MEGARIFTVVSCLIVLLVTALAAEAATIRVRCEKRSDRSKISVDGKDLTPGSYAAMVVSGSNEATSTLQGAVGDEAGFDFDSAPDDVAAGATEIGVDFIQGGQVTGKILDEAGMTVISDPDVNCKVKD